MPFEIAVLSTETPPPLTACHGQVHGLKNGASFVKLTFVNSLEDSPV